MALFVPSQPASSAYLAQVGAHMFWRQAGTWLSRVPRGGYLGTVELENGKSRLHR
jgi:hypothetical protein